MAWDLTDNDKVVSAMKGSAFLKDPLANCYSYYPTCAFLITKVLTSQGLLKSKKNIYGYHVRTLKHTVIIGVCILKRSDTMKNQPKRTW